MMLLEVTFEVLWFSAKSPSFEPFEAMIAWFFRLIIIAQVYSNHDK
jgi:hypothetical protein